MMIEQWPRLKLWVLGVLTVKMSWVDCVQAFMDDLQASSVLQWAAWLALSNRWGVLQVKYILGVNLLFLN